MQLQTGDVLLELQSKKEDRKRFETALARAFGEDGGICHLIPRAKLVISDLVWSTEVVDIEEALKAVLGERHGAPPRIDLTKKCNRCCNLAFVKLDADPARKIELAARLKFRWVNC